MRGSRGPQWGLNIAQSQLTPEHEILRGLLRRARLEAGLSQTELGQRLGLSQLLISRSELGDRKIDALELRAFCRAMGISYPDFTRQLDDLLSERERHSPHASEAPPAQAQPERTRRASPRRPRPSAKPPGLKPQPRR